MITRSFTFTLFLRLLPVLALAAALPWFLAYWMDRGWVVVCVSTVFLLAAMWWALRRATAPIRSLLRAQEAIREGAFRDEIVPVDVPSA